MEANFDGIGGGSTVGQNNVSATATTTAKTDNDKTNSNSNFFLANENLCGQTLLTLITKGHTICANIRMLSERIPMAFIIAANMDGNNNNGTREGKMTKNKGGGGGGLFSIFASSSTPSSGDTNNNKSQTKNNATDKDDETLSEVATKYSRFLFDFSYLHNPEEAEASLTTVTTTTSSSTSLPPFESEEENNNVHELEREFTINHENSIIEFYNLFYSIYNYQSELHTFITDLITGYYIQYTVESVLLDMNGKILLCEAIWLLGIMLILMERLLPGPIRERLIIAYFRLYTRDGDITCIDHICKLCKSTGVQHPHSTTTSSSTSSTKNNGLFVINSDNNSWSYKYPMEEEKLFHRFPLPSDLIRNVIGCLISDDIYSQSSIFPNIDHRSTRLSRQASMLYVILFFFEPCVLRDEYANMREIVDKYFHDNWVIHVYGGMTADLSYEWNHFPAAKRALDNVLQVDNNNVRTMHIKNAKLIGQCIAELRAYLTMGILTDAFVLDNRHDLLNCIRRCNIAIRWRVLHRRTLNVTYNKIICLSVEQATTDPKLEADYAINNTHVVSLILLTSQLELQLKDIFYDLLKRKESIWMNCRANVCTIMRDLANYYKGDQTLTRITRHDGLIDWFSSMANEVYDLSYDQKIHFTVIGRQIQHCVQALEEVELYDMVDRDVQVKSFLKEARDLLLQMARAVSVNEDICEDIRWISDMSYGIESMKSYVTIIHSRISKDPSNVSLLRGFFLKLSSSLDGTFERINQLHSPETKSVINYYSLQLVAFVREVLGIVPVSVFAILVQMSDLLERRIQCLPARVQADKLITYAQLGDRYKLNMMAHEISVFADGILQMETTVLGGIEVHPHKLVDEGLRKELVSYVSGLLNNLLQFDFSADSETVSSMSKHLTSAIKSLASLSERFKAFRMSLECVDDYLCMHGLKMWHEEMGRIMNYNVEQEVNKYLLKKVLDSNSKFQSDIAPIPQFFRTKNEPSCINFMGRIVSMLIKISDAQYTTYSLERNGWYMNDDRVVCGSNTIKLIREAIGVYGLSGIDRLLCYRTLHELHRFVKFFRTNVSKQGVLLEQLRDELFPEWKTPKDATAIYAAASKKTEMLMLPMLTCFRRVGQAQLLRRMVRFELQQCAKVDAKLLQHTIFTYNAMSVTQWPRGLPEHSDDIKRMCDITIAVGVGNPLETIFMKTDPLEGLPVLLLFFVISSLPKLNFDSTFGSLAKVKTGYPIDGWPIIAGISTLLKQFHPSYAKSFLAYLGQFIRVTVQTYATMKQGRNDDDIRLSADTLKNTVVLLEQFCDMSGLPSSAMYEHVPQYIIELCASL